MMKSESNLESKKVQIEFSSKYEAMHKTLRAPPPPTSVSRMRAHTGTLIHSGHLRASWHTALPL